MMCEAEKNSGSVSSTIMSAKQLIVEYRPTPPCMLQFLNILNSIWNQDTSELPKKKFLLHVTQK